MSRLTFVLDTNFLISLAVSDESYHKEATSLYRVMEAFQDRIKIVIPQLVLYELIVTLRRKGHDREKLEQRLLRLNRIPNVVCISLGEFSALQHAESILNESDQSKALRTNDFMICSMAMNFDGHLLTFDKAAYSHIRPIYENVYYCAKDGPNGDDTSRIIDRLILELDQA